MRSLLVALFLVTLVAARAGQDSDETKNVHPNWREQKEVPADLIKDFGKMEV
jgi:hypothetical protein